jgi:enoyl-CoA hydratase/carnithine racemase
MSSPDSTGLRIERDGPVVTVVLDRPDDQNRLTREVLTALGDLLERLAGDDAAQVLIITGSGSEFFSMGILSPLVRQSYTKAQVLELVRLGNRVFDALETLPQLVIAALNGATRAGAAEMVLACDIRLAASHATIAWPEALWGGFPGAGAPVRLPGLVGRARALELICTGREVDAAEMERLGLVLSVHAPERLLPETRALAARIAQSGPLAIRGAKRIATLGDRSGFAAARTLSDSLRAAFEWSQDVDEGAAAHREGRPPRFTGR